MKRIIQVFASVIVASLIFIQPISVLAANNKRIEVDLTHQELYAYQGNTLTYSFPISSGLIRTPTPLGTFYPQRKLLSDEMIGGSKLAGDYYDLPNVPYDVYFYGGYALHGTYWHHNFGHPMSHGCINLPTPDAKLLYNWIDYSTPITIYGTTPTS